MAPFFALKHAPAAMGKLMTVQGNYPNAAPKDQKYGSIVVVSSVASTHGGECPGLHSLAVSFTDGHRLLGTGIDNVISCRSGRGQVGCGIFEG